MVLNPFVLSTSYRALEVRAGGDDGTGCFPRGVLSFVLRAVGAHIDLRGMIGMLCLGCLTHGS